MSPLETRDVGETLISMEDFEYYLTQISDRYTERTYDLFENNCNTFSNEICEFLTGSGIPSYITSLPNV